MKTLKRVLAVVASIASILVLLISVGGVFGSWVFNGAATRGVTKVFDGVENGLNSASGAADRVDSQLGGARDDVRRIEDTVVQLGNEVIDTSLALTLIEKTVGEELFSRGRVSARYSTHDPRLHRYI